MDCTLKIILLIIFAFIFLRPFMGLFTGLIGLILLICTPILLLAGILFVPFGIIMLLVKFVKMTFF